jgi:hypothetical protein
MLKVKFFLPLTSSVSIHTYGAVRNLRDRRKDLYELKQKK